MREFITIRNFGPLKDLEDVEIRPFTVLVGESAIGKSTLMKVVSMMRFLYKMANIRSYLRLSKITKSPFRLRFDAMMKETGMQSMLRYDSHIEYYVQTDSGNFYDIRVFAKKLSQLPQIRKEDLSFIKISFVSENRNVIPMWSEKASTNSGASLGFYFHETLADFSHVSESDQSVNLDYVNLKLHVSHPKGKATRYNLEHNTDKNLHFELREASSGIQTSVPLALIVKHFSHDFSFKEAFSRSVLNYLHDIDRLTKFQAITEPAELKKDIFIHIEEPELSLFPDAQCKLIDELVFAAKHAKEDRRVGLIFATHSPYILNYLNVILHQKNAERAQLTPADMAVYRLYDGKVQNLMVQDENGTDIVDTYDLTEMMSHIYDEFTTLNA